jgi:hypothetical protein
MSDVLEELMAIEGFKGICLFYPAAGKILQAMPATYKEAELVEIGSSLASAFQYWEGHLEGLRDISLYEEDNLFLMRKMSREIFVYVMAEADANLFLLRIALQLIDEQSLQNSRAFARR